MGVEPRLGFRFADDREDLDFLVGEVIEHPEFAYPKTILRLSQPTKPLDPALRHLGRFVAEVRFESIANRRAMNGRQRFQRARGMVLLTEIGDWRRFASPRHLMAYLGLVPRERSSGDRERRGSITKAGNSHVRHALVRDAARRIDLKEHAEH